MRPFDLAKALAGEPVITREGKQVTDIHHFKTVRREGNVIAVIDGDWFTFSPDGAYNKLHGNSNMDLFMAPVKRQEWRNIYKGKNSGKLTVSPARYASYEDAIAYEYEDMDQNNFDFIHPVKIHEWEE